MFKTTIQINNISTQEVLLFIVANILTDYFTGYDINKGSSWSIMMVNNDSYPPWFKMTVCHDDS